MDTFGDAMSRMSAGDMLLASPLFRSISTGSWADLFFLVCATGFGLLWVSITLYTYTPILRAWMIGFLSEELATIEKEVVWLTREEHLSEEPRPIVADGGILELPTIDVLVPAYDEAGVLEDTVRALANAHYPPDRLTIVVLVEPEDRATREVVAELQQEYVIVEVVVPTWYPGDANKPRALNYGFEVTNGEIVGVVDAEDIVEPTLPEKVVQAITVRDADYAQGLLDMVNEGDGWRNAIFRGEYGFWYRLFLPASRHAGYPIPLGGSTNFFRRSVLETVSEIRVDRFGHPWGDAHQKVAEKHDLLGWVPWDPRNVTEDFELGMFLWREGFELELIRTITLEESPVDLGNWMRQRTRWHKGKLYTLAQAVRHPPSGVAGKLHIFAQAVIPHYGALTLIGIVLVFGLANLFRYDPPTSIWLLLAAGACLLPLAVGVQIAGYWLASTESDMAARRRRFVLIALLLPVYWLLTWVAALRASWQLYAGIIGWEKTTHNGNHHPDVNRAQLPGYRRW